jgi:Tol biopolymer transport system component/DNA-binding winged helix-turn-helix (wHTH) protein
MTENVQNRVRFGPFEADLRTHELWKGGIRLRLSGQPFQVLEMLLDKPGELVTRDELRLRMWPGDTFVDFSHGLNAAVNKLREALSDSAENPKYIETLPRRGYRFIGEVERAAPVEIRKSEPAIPPAVVADPPPAVIPLTNEPAVLEAVEVAPPKRRRRWLKIALFAGGLLVFGLIGLIVVMTILDQVRHEERGGVSSPLRAAAIARISDPLMDPAFSPDGNLLAIRRLGRSPLSSGIFVKRIGEEELRQLTHVPTDCCPAFSPDGLWVAFSRLSEREFSIFVVPVSGGSERRIYSGPSRTDRGEVAWAPDGKSLVFSGSSEDGSDLVSLAVVTFQSKKVTHPAPGQIDKLPAYSPDGKSLAFIRTDNEGFEQLMVLSSDGNLRKIAAQPGRILGPPAWNADSGSIIFSSAEEQGPQLWRVPIGGGAAPVPIPEAGRNAWHPSVSRRGYRLAYQQNATMASLWQIDLAKPDEQVSRKVLARGDYRNEGPQLSPDGKKLVFMSDRSGSMEIWVSAADGSNPVQLSALGKAGTPRWSPDSKWIAFDSDARGRSAIYVVNADGGEPRVVVQGDFENRVPSWSHDGKWIYFASDRNQDWQVWKVPVDGGSQVQITGGGGFAPLESEDGKYLYYAKTQTPDPAIWRVSVSGGDETVLSPQIVPRIWATWALTKNGIYFVPESSDRVPSVWFFDFGARQVRSVASLNKFPFWLSVSADGKSVLLDQLDQDQSTIVVVDNFH